MDNGLWTILNKGADEAAERGEDVLRLRGGCIIQFVYFAVLSVMIMVNHLGNHYIFGFAMAILQIMVLVGSYRTGHIANRMVFVASMAFSALYMTVALGVPLGFQFFLYVGLLMLLLESHISYGNKYVFCIVCVIITIVLHSISSFCGRAYTDSMLQCADGLRILNEIVVAVHIIVLGMTFARYQVEAERQLYLVNQKLKLAADTDQLTHLPNRRAILEVLGEIDNTRDETISIAMGDIDHFKVVNDTYGHDAGDAVLQNVSAAIRDFMDRKGYCARWGGEEFLLVFADANGDDAYLLLDQFRRKLAELVTEYEGHSIKVTMTFGLEEHGFYQTTDRTIKDADDKLYTGKETGRNKVVY